MFSGGNIYIYIYIYIYIWGVGGRGRGVEAGEGGAVVLIKLAREGRNKQKCLREVLD